MSPDRDMSETEEKRTYWFVEPWAHVDEYPHFVPPHPDTPIKWVDSWDWDNYKHKYEKPDIYGPRPKGGISPDDYPPQYRP